MSDITITITKDGAAGEYAWDVAVGMHRDLQDKAFAMERSTADAFVRWGSLLIQIKTSLEKKGQPWLKFLETASNIKRAQKAMRLAAVAAGKDGSLDVAKTKGAIVTFNQDARERGVRPLSTDSISRRSAEIAYGIRGGDPLHGPARDHAGRAGTAQLPVHRAMTLDEEIARADELAAMEPEVPMDAAYAAMSPEEREAEDYRRQRVIDGADGDDDFDFDVDAESEDEDGEDAARESGDGDAAGLSIAVAGAATTTCQKDLDTLKTSSDAGSAGSSHHGVGGAGVVGYVGVKPPHHGHQDARATQHAKETQLGLDGIYAEAARVRDVAGRMERGELSDAMRKRLMLLVAEIDGGQAT